MPKRMHTFACQKCKTNVTVEIPEEAIPIAHPNLVGCLYPNPPKAKCIECGLVYIPQIQQILPTWIWLPFEEQTESGLVISGAPMPKFPFNKM
jgi:hypothetical protein